MFGSGIGRRQAKNIQELHCIMMIRKPIDRKSGTMRDRILKRLIYGNQIPENQIQISGIRESSQEFVRQRGEGKNRGKELPTKEGRYRS